MKYYARAPKGRPEPPSRPSLEASHRLHHRLTCRFPLLEQDEKLGHLTAALAVEELTDDVCPRLRRSVEYAQEFATGARSDLLDRTVPPPAIPRLLKLRKGAPAKATALEGQDDANNRTQLTCT